MFQRLKIFVVQSSKTKLNKLASHIVQLQGDLKLRFEEIASSYFD